MQIKWPVAIPLILFCALADPATHGSRESAGAAADRAWSELASSMEKMHHAMSSVAPSGDTDVDFVRLMLPHHQAALDMAKTELLLGKSPELRRLAQEIIADQHSEIDLMELWLKKHAPGRQKAGGPPDSSVKGNWR
jgi:uncharacterized protein (DUF305 family)